MRYLTIISFLFLATACANPSVTAKTTKVVDRTFAMATSGSRSGSDRFSIAATAYNANGKLALCAAIAVTGSSTFTQEWGPAIADAMYITIGGERVITGVPFAAVFIDEETAKGKQATCGITDEPWKAEWTGKPVGFRVGQVRLTA